MSKIYEIVIYTTNMKDYVDKVIENIDKKKRISHILFKDKCLNLNKVHFLKSLRALGRDPEKVVFVDVSNSLFSITSRLGYCNLKTFSG
jgi:TFIIF-interacting CTD phosphatase-like protein